jgi:hypothetical protein
MSQEMVELSEMIGKMAWGDLFAAAPEAVRQKLGLQTRVDGGALQLSAPGIDSLLFNCAVGLQPAAPEGRGQLARIVDRFAARGIDRFMLRLDRQQCGPAAEALLAEHGVVPFHRAWAQLVRRDGPAPEPGAGAPAVTPVPRRLAEPWAEILCHGFDLPLAARPVLAALVGRPRWLTMAVQDRGQPVAAGALFWSTHVAYFALAATRPDWRCRGAQSALLLAGIRQTLDHRCRYMVGETGEAVAGQPNHSYDNLARVGFEAVGVTRNFTPRGVGWLPASDSSRAVA